MVMADSDRTYIAVPCEWHPVTAVVWPVVVAEADTDTGRVAVDRVVGTAEE